MRSRADSSRSCRTQPRCQRCGRWRRYCDVSRAGSQSDTGWTKPDIIVVASSVTVAAPSATVRACCWVSGTAAPNLVRVSYPYRIRKSNIHRTRAEDMRVPVDKEPVAAVSPANGRGWSGGTGNNTVPSWAASCDQSSAESWMIPRDDPLASQQPPGNGSSSSFPGGFPPDPRPRFARNVACITEPTPSEARPGVWGNPQEKKGLAAIGAIGVQCSGLARTERVDPEVAHRELPRHRHGVPERPRQICEGNAPPPLVPRWLRST